MILPFVPQALAASNWTADCQFSGVATIRGIECIVLNLTSTIPPFLALVATGMLILGGVNYMNAGSDPKALSAAQNTITWAVIGIVLLSVGWLALVLVEQFTGAKVTQFGFQ